jgi:cob(I)alamin adenosyltransferase
MNETIARAQRAWELAKEKIASGDYDLIVLDEFTYTMVYKWLDTDDVMEWLRLNRPSNLHLVITGRSAPEALVAAADLVTEMHLVKHPYEQGIQAQAGVEF